MADVAPQIPQTQDKSFLNLPKAASAFQGDQSGKFLGEMLGDVVSGVAGLADQFVKRNTGEEIHEKMDALQEEKNQGLSASINAATKGTIADEKGNPVSIQDLFTKKEEDRTPNDIKNIEQIARNLKAGREHGSYSDTYYRMQVDKLAKDMRSRYPGYRDYIDHKIKEEEGSSANELASSMIKDLNAALAGTKDNKNKIESQVFQNLKYPEVYAGYVRWKSGDPNYGDNEMLGTISRNEAKDKELKDKEQQAIMNAKTKEQERDNYSDVASQKFQNIFTQAWNVFAMADPKADWATPAKADAWILDKAMKGEPPTEQEMQMFPLLMQKTRGLFYSKANEWLNETVNPNDPADQRRTRRMIIGDKKVDELFRTGLSQLDDVEKHYTGGNWSMLGLTKQLNEAASNDALRTLFKGDKESVLAKVAALNKAGGPQFVKDFATQMIGNSKLGELGRTWANDKTLKVIMNPPNHFLSITDDVNEAASRGVGGAAVDFEISNLSTVIKDPRATPETKDKVMKWGFGPGNDKLFQNVPDSTTTSSGVKVNGKLDMYKNLTDPEFIKGAKQTKDWPMYQRTVEDWAKYYLIPKDLKTLTEYQQNNLESDYVNITYSKEDHQFHVHAKTMKELYESSPRAASTGKYGNLNANNISGVALITNGAIKNINEVIKSYVNIAEANKEDVDGYVTKQLVNAGYAPHEGKNPLVDALRKATSGPTKEEGKKAGEKAPRTPDFINSPPTADFPASVDKAIP